MRDIAPYFASSFILIFAHIAFYKTGSALIIIWFIQLNPITGLLLKADNTNLSTKSEKAFLNDNRFWIPLHFYNVLETLNWIWQLIVVSDVVHFDHKFFNCKPETNMEFYIFSLVWGMFTGLNAIQGHEMVHRKEWYNKYMGNWAYTKFMCSHFLDEHIKGHHKTMATPDDPCTARKGQTFYEFLPKSVLG